jgi:hypothetical protein
LIVISVASNIRALYWATTATLLLNFLINFLGIYGLWNRNALYLAWVSMVFFSPLFCMGGGKGRLTGDLCRIPASPSGSF